MSRHYMENRTDEITPGHWSKMLDADEAALRLAKNQELAKCDDVKQEHWGEDMKVEMDKNSKLMGLIYTLSKNKELFDLSKTEKIHPFMELLQPDNLSMFYDIIVRRSLIQCKMFPELKAQHEAWLRGDDGDSDNNEQYEECEGVGVDGDEVQEGRNVQQSRDLIDKLKPIFFNKEEDVLVFLDTITGMQSKDITDLVNKWVEDKRISDYGTSRKGVLWAILHEARLYDKTKQNWNRRVF